MFMARSTAACALPFELHFDYSQVATATALAILAIPCNGRSRVGYGDTEAKRADQGRVTSK